MCSSGLCKANDSYSRYSLWPFECRIRVPAFRGLYSELLLSLSLSDERTKRRHFHNKSAHESTTCTMKFDSKENLISIYWQRTATSATVHMTWSQFNSIHMKCTSFHCEFNCTNWIKHDWVENIVWFMSEAVQWYCNYSLDLHIWIELIHDANKYVRYCAGFHCRLTTISLLDRVLSFLSPCRHQNSFAHLTRSELSQPNAAFDWIQKRNPKSKSEKNFYFQNSFRFDLLFVCDRNRFSNRLRILLRCIVATIMWIRLWCGVNVLDTMQINDNVCTKTKKSDMKPLPLSHTHTAPRQTRPSTMHYLAHQ